MSEASARIPSLGLIAVLLLTTSGCASVGGVWPFSMGFFASTPPLTPPPGEGKGGPHEGGAKNPSSPEKGGIQPVGHAGLQGNGASANNGAAANQASRPTVVGTPLNLLPGETPAERSLDLARRLATAEEQNLALTTHAQHLRVQIEQRDNVIGAAEKELRASAEEVAQTRAELHQHKQELLKMRERMRAIEMENAATLRSIITWLERALEGQGKDKPPERPREPDERDTLLDPIKPLPKK